MHQMLHGAPQMTFKRKIIEVAARSGNEKVEARVHGTPAFEADVTSKINTRAQHSNALFQVLLTRRS